jgi:tetratricopeptide (TPR) repeat protein
LSQRDYTQAAELYEESLALRRELGNRGPIATSLLNLGNVALSQGDFGRATPYYQESLDIFRSLGDGQNIALALGNLGLAALYEDDADKAEPLLEECLAMSREMGNTRQVAIALNSLSCVAMSRKEYERARASSQKGLILHRDLGDNKGVADCLQSLAEIEVLLGERDGKALLRAATLLAAQDALRAMIGYPHTASGQPLYEQTVETARAQLGKTAWAEAWVEGHSMSVEEIVAYAVSDVS